MYFAADKFGADSERIMGRRNTGKENSSISIPLKNGIPPSNCTPTYPTLFPGTMVIVPLQEEAHIRF